jgi:hypothetical protein
MSAPHDEALAHLDGAALTRQTRRFRHPRTGRACAITMAAGLWRNLDDLAREYRTTPTELCHFALQEHPDAAPAEALWRFLWSAYIQPFCRAPPEVQ